MRIFVAFSLLFLASLNGQTPFQRADLSANFRIPIRSTRLDCVGFPDHARKTLHAVCSELAASRVAWEGDLVAPKSEGQRTFTGVEYGSDRVEWSIVRDAASLKWTATSNGEGSPTASGTL